MQDTLNPRFNQVERKGNCASSFASISAKPDYASSRKGYFLLAELLCHQRSSKEKMIEEGEQEYNTLLPYFPNHTPIELYTTLKHHLSVHDGQISIF